MDRKLVLAVVVAVPVLAAVFFVLTRVLPPLLGFTAGLVCYWLFLAVMLWRNTTAAQRGVWLMATSAGWGIGALCILPVLVTGMAGMAVLHTVPVALLLPIAMAAVLNATLEELFWRGAILPRPDEQSAALAVILFAGWHVALLAAGGIVLPGGPAGLLVGAAALGSIWMAARLRTGTLGAGILSNAGVNLFAMIVLVAANLP